MRYGVNMGKQRYTEEFKIEAVKQVTERGYSVKEVAENLGVAAWSIYKWKEKYSDKNKSDHKNIDLQRENIELRKELKRVQEERDILKKAAAFFAKESDKDTHL